MVRGIEAERRDIPERADMPARAARHTGKISLREILMEPTFSASRSLKYRLSRHRREMIDSD